MDVERQKFNKLQGDVLRLGADWLQICQILDRFKEGVAQSQARCNDFWACLEYTQYTRNEVHHSPELEWMHMEENRPEFAAQVVEEVVLMFPL